MSSDYDIGPTNPRKFSHGNEVEVFWILMDTT